MGTSINANYSSAYGPNRNAVDQELSDTSRVMYQTGFFDMSDSLYWQDININIYRKFSKSFQLKN